MEPNDSAVTRLPLRADPIEALGYSRSDFRCNLLLLETWCFFNNTPEMLEWNIDDFPTRISITLCLYESQFKILSCLCLERGSAPKFNVYIFSGAMLSLLWPFLLERSFEVFVSSSLLQTSFTVIKKMNRSHVFEHKNDWIERSTTKKKNYHMVCFKGDFSLLLWLRFSLARLIIELPFTPLLITSLQSTCRWEIYHKVSLSIAEWIFITLTSCASRYP